MQWHGIVPDEEDPRPRRPSSGVHGDPTRENVKDTIETTGNGNARFAAEEKGEVRRVQLVIGNGSTPANLKRLLRTCRCGHRQKAQDMVMQTGNACLAEQTRQVENPTVPILEAAPVEARLDSAFALINTSKESCGRCTRDAHGGTAENGGTMTELEQANIAVEVAKKKVGPATGLASDVTMLL